MAPFFKLNLLILLVFGLPINIQAQKFTGIEGYVKDTLGKPISLVHITVSNTNFGTTTNDSGYYKLAVASGKSFHLLYSCIGYQSATEKILLKPGEVLHLNVNLKTEVRHIQEVSVTSEVERASSINRISIKDFHQIPNPGGGIEGLIKTMGAASSNELSSQYSVRGGNFDENLVYVNDIELNRPFLIRSGQQEGLSFINPDMVSAVKFSAGGFEPRYGDKMSSVLDVSYRKPTAYECNANASLLGGGLTLEGISKNNKLSFIGGVRYKTSQYLLNTFDTKGTYKPSFLDIQSMITYQPWKKLDISLLGNFAQNKYLFIPETQSTNFGTINQVYNLTVYYDGKELDKYRLGLGALTLNYKPTPNLSLKLISSAYSSYEQETFDIQGEYLINELDMIPGSSAGSDSLLNIGVGGMLNHARNFLWADTWMMSHIGIYIVNKHTIRWSLEYKHENIEDKLNEWVVIDSAGYSSPYSPNNILLNNYANAINNVISSRISGYLQDTWQFGENTHYYITGGIRFNHWTYNGQTILSPRLRISIKPLWQHDFMFHLALGVYDQPPVYKEMRDFQGNLNPNIKAQRSFHLVLGSDYNLQLWDRPFKFTSEVYYKHLSDLIPYKVDNLRIKYTAQNNASGYTTGLDLKLNGEFVPGIESWASLSFLKTEEIQNDFFYYNSQGELVKQGYYPRPTDQRIIFNMFFQDYLPNNETFQVHLNLVYGSALQISPPDSKRFDETFPIGPYRRVDMGISKIFKDQNRNSKIALFNQVKEFIVGVEIFNLLNISNKASYLWIRTVSNQENVPNEFAVPNYLTSRRVNLKLMMKF
jgi:hypothetical protein